MASRDAVICEPQSSQLAKAVRRSESLRQTPHRRLGGVPCQTDCSQHSASSGEAKAIPTRQQVTGHKGPSNPGALLHNPSVTRPASCEPHGSVPAFRHQYPLRHKHGQPHWDEAAAEAAEEAAAAAEAAAVAVGWETCSSNRRRRSPVTHSILAFRSEGCRSGRFRLQARHRGCCYAVQAGQFETW
jgi:hypothetical protein